QGNIYHTDFGSLHYRGDCFDFVMQKFFLDFTGALKKIDKDFGLGITDGSFTQREAPIYEIPQSQEKSRSKSIQVMPRKFTRAMLEYWGKIYQGEDDLKAENVYEVSQLFLDKRRVNLPKDKLVIGYLYAEQYWKIYVPHAEEEKGEFKWMST